MLGGVDWWCGRERLRALESLLWRSGKILGIGYLIDKCNSQVKIAISRYVHTNSLWKK